jgi:D-amino-acid dehydrogenase
MSCASHERNCESTTNHIRGKTPVTVIGAGIIGLATAYSLMKQGAQVTVVDRDPEGDKASFGNAGGIAVTEVVPAAASVTPSRVIGWMLDPLGPVAVRPFYAATLLPWLLQFAKSGTTSEIERLSRALATINSRVYEDLIPLMRDVGLECDLQQNGALSLYETEEGYRRDAADWECKRRRGVVFEDITGAEARRLEPALGPIIHRAVIMPAWSHISDPKRLMTALRVWLQKHGASIKRGEVVGIVHDQTASSILQLHGGEQISSVNTVVAAGAWSSTLVRGLGDKVLLESERGYNSTLRDPGITIARQLLFAERKFVATPLSCGLRIGGAAEFGGLHAAPNYKRSRTLVELSKRYLPDLRAEGALHWAGHRPATPDSLPIIGCSMRHQNVFYAFGHGHLGLTQAATTGRLIAELVFQRRSTLDLSAFQIGRFN